MSIISRRSFEMDVRRERRMVRRKLSAVRRRLRRWLLLEGLAWTLGTIVALAAASLFLDRLFRLEVGPRVGLLAAAATATTMVVARRLVKPFFTRMPDLDLAQTIDQRRRGVAQHAANVLQLPALLTGPGAPSQSLVYAAVREQAEAFERADLHSLFATTRRNGLVLTLVGLATIALGFAWCCRDTAELWFARWFRGSEVRWPQENYLSLAGLGEERRLLVPRGETATLEVDSAAPFTRTQRSWRLAGRGAPLHVWGPEMPTGAPPGRIGVTYRVAGERRDGVFTRVDEHTFRYEIPAVAEPLSISIAGGDDWFGPIELEPVERPAIEELTLVATPLGSLQSQNYTVSDADSQLQFLPKTKIELRLKARQPLIEAGVTGFGEQPHEWQRVDSRNYLARWEMAEAVTLEFKLISERGRLESKPAFLTVGKLIDRDPRVTLRATGVGRRITPQARVPLVLRAIDDFGLASWSTQLETTLIEEGRPKTAAETIDSASLPVGDDGALPLDIERAPTIALAERGLLPGAALRLRVAATDRCALGPRTGHSRWLSFQVVAPEELFYEILMRQREQRNRFSAATALATSQAEALQALASVDQAPGLARQHQVIDRQVWQIANQLDATLQEMTLNDLGNAQARDLLQQSIIGPLRELHDVKMPMLKSQLEAIASQPAVESTQQQQALALQSEVVATMHKILSAMSQWESFVDVVNQLRNVIKLQNQVLETTERMKRDRIKGLFDE